MTFARPTTPPPRKDDDPNVQALFEEIDAEVKAESFRKFLERYGNLILAGVAAIVLGTLVFNLYTNWIQKEQQKETAILLALMDRDPSTFTDEDLKSVLETYVRLGKEGHGAGIRLAAAVSEASVLQKKGQKDAAIQRLDQLHNDGSIPRLYRDYALLQEVRMAMDGGDAAKLLSQLQPLLADGNAWQLSALQLAALLEAKQGHADKAVAYLQRVIDAPDASVAAREESLQLLRLYKAM